MKRARRIAFFILIGVFTFFIGVVATRLRDFLRSEQTQPSPWQVLLSVQNQDLQALDQQSVRKVRDAIKQVTNELDASGPQEPKPVLFKSFVNTSGEQRYLLVEEVPQFFFPSAPWLHVHVFDLCGRRLRKFEFGGGHRRFLVGVRVRHLERGSDQLIVDTEADFTGHSSHQFYELVGARITLVYLTSDGQLEHNNYQNANLTIGPVINRSTDEWEQALNSPDQAEVLSALIWLGGNHWNGEPAPYEDYRTDGEAALDLRARSSVRKRVKELSELDQPNDYCLQTAATEAFKTMNK